MIRCLCLILAGLISQYGALAQPQSDLPTIVSLDYCADQYVLGLADPSQILALSPDAEKPFSYYRYRAKGYPKTRLSAEEILILKPDIILRSYGGTERDISFYERFGIEVVTIGYALDFPGIADVVETVATAIDRPEAAVPFVEKLRRPASRQSSSALYYVAGERTAGEATQISSVLAHAGMRNLAGPGSWLTLSLEGLVLNPPERIISAYFEFGPEATSHWSLGRHKVLQTVFNTVDVIPAREDRLSCTSWLLADEAEDLRRSASGKEE
ncbi:MAG: ABC transporter substrate-binding protein [Pseudomonadota bacterium]